MRIRLTLRLAAKVLARARGRNALIAAMIALPVIAMVAFGTVFASMKATPQEALGYQLGRTQAVVTMSGNGSVRQEPLDPTVVVEDGSGNTKLHTTPTGYLPQGALTIEINEVHVSAKSATGVAPIIAVVGRSWDPLLDGRFTISSGRTPSGAGEAMVTASTLTRLGLRLGDAVAFTAPAAQSYRIVGILDDEQSAAQVAEVFVADPPTATGNLAGLDLAADTHWYVTGTTVTWPDVQRLNAVGATALSRAVVLDPPATVDPMVRAAAANRSTGSLWQSLGVLIVGIFALLQVALLAAAAFMVGARQQERTLAILASVGADRRLLRATVSLGGLLLGAIGAVVGLALGLPLGWLIMTLTRDGSASQYPGFHVDPFLTGAIVVFAIGFSWIAASIPARSASRVDVVAALRGATRPVPPRRRTPVVGIVFVVLGGALCVVGGALTGVFANSADVGKITVMVSALVLGPIVILVGVILIAPSILRLVSRVFSVGGVGARLASRDAARNSARTVPAIAAIISTVFVAAFGTCLAASLQVGATRTYQYQSAMNQVSLSLVEGHDSAATTLTPSAPLVSALTSAFHLSDIRVLSSAGPDTTSASTKGGLVVAPVEQLSFLCPWDERQPHPSPNEEGQNGALAPCDDQPSIMGSATTTGYDTKVMIGDAKDLALILGEKPSARATSALAHGEAVSFYPQFVSKTGTLQLAWWPSESDRGWDGGKPVRSKTISAVVQQPVHDLPFGILIAQSTAARLGIPVAPTMLLGALKSPATSAQQDAANAAVTSITGDDYVSPEVETGPVDYARIITLILLLVSTVISLASSIAAIGLARSDGRRDDAILGAIGASTLLRRSFGFWQAVIIAGVGSIIGVLLGGAEFVALTIPHFTGAPGGLDPAAPVLALVGIAVVIPAIIAVGAWLTSRRGRTSVLDRSVIA